MSTPKLNLMVSLTNFEIQVKHCIKYGYVVCKSMYLWTIYIHIWFEKNLENFYISVAYKEVEKLQLVHARGSTRMSLEYPTLVKVLIFPWQFPLYEPTAVKPTTV